MIVFDSSTIILLAKIEILDIFIKNSGKKIVIPKEVETETTSIKKGFDALLIKRRIEEKNIEAIKVKDRKFLKKLMDDFKLDFGEAEVISIAMQENAEIVATDDRKCIFACKVLKIPFTSAIAILLLLYKKGLLTKDEAKEKFEKLCYFGRYKKSIIADARNRLED